jgi:hypothetical protein
MLPLPKQIETLLQSFRVCCELVQSGSPLLEFGGPIADHLVDCRHIPTCHGRQLGDVFVRVSESSPRRLLRTELLRNEVHKSLGRGHNLWLLEDLGAFADGVAALLEQASRHTRSIV